MKKPIVAAALSALIPGLGQLYNLHWAKGIGFLAAALIWSGFVRNRMVFENPSVLAVGAAFLLFGMVFWSVVDAYRSAEGTP